jgi:ABC-type sulfate transport system permease component
MEDRRRDGQEEMSFRRTTLGAAFCLFIFYSGLLLSLFYFARGRGLWPILIHPNTLYSIRLSLVTATLATFFAVTISLPAAYALSRFEFRGKRIVDTFLEIPMIMSPIALGASLLVFFNTPLALRGLVASVILCWAKAVGEFGATVMLAGAMPGKTETMPIAIFTALSSANIEKTIVLILILAGFGLCTLYGVRLMTGERRRHD